MKKRIVQSFWLIASFMFSISLFGDSEQVKFHWLRADSDQHSAIMEKGGDLYAKAAFTGTGVGLTFTTNQCQFGSLVLESEKKINLQNYQFVGEFFSTDKDNKYYKKWHKVGSTPAQNRLSIKFGCGWYRIRLQEKTSKKFVPILANFRIVSGSTAIGNKHKDYKYGKLNLKQWTTKF